MNLVASLPIIEDRTFLLPDAVPISATDAQLYFFHVPKTAGTSFIKLLKENFAPSEICAPGLWSHLLGVPSQEVRVSKLIVGHFYAMLSQYENSPRRYITMIRHPFARAMSHYRHVARYPGHYFYEKTVALGSFSAFIRDPETNPLISNFYAKSLTWNHDVIKMSAAFTTEERLTLFLERKIETSPLNYDEPLAFNVAENRLKQFALVGVTERFKESIQSLCSSMGWPVPDELPSENIDPMSAAMNMQLNADDEQLLTTLNQVDLKLYDLAQEMLGRLLAQA